MTLTTYHEMNWICLYCAELGGQPWLFYGYATYADLPSATDWRRQEIDSFNGVTLISYQRAADNATLASFRSQLHHGSTVLDLGGGRTVIVEHGGLASRPDVISSLRTADPAGVPVSLSDQLTRVGTHWQLDPGKLLAALSSHPQLPADEREECLSRILSHISGVTGIDLLGRDAGRFGNFEDVRYLLGSYDRPEGLRHHPEAASGDVGASVVVWIEPPLSGCSPLLVGCRLFNGHPRTGRTLVFDELRRWPGPDIQPLRFTASEPISSYEVSVWAEANGQLVARQDEWVIRSINGTVTIPDPWRWVSTEWDKKLTEPQRRRVAATTAVSTSPLVVGGYRDDPWVSAEVQKRSLLHQLGPAAGSGRFFPAGDEHHVEAILFLVRLIRKRGVAKVLIADPYLDKTAVNSLLVRVPDVPEVVLLSSRDRPNPKEPEFWCKERTSPPPTEDPVAELIEACERHRNALPDKVRAVNVAHADGKGQQFHDRNVVVEFSGGAREVWSLTNSLSMVARRYPLLVTLVSPDVGRAVAEHLSQLQNGAVAGKPDLRAEVIWEKPARSEPQPPPATPRVSPFKAERRILEILVPDATPTSRLTEALVRGLLEPATQPGTTTWRVQNAKLAEVLASGIEAVRAAGDGAAGILRALGEWEYHGGPSESDYTFDASVVPHAEAALRCIVSSARPAEVSGPLDVSIPATFPECLDDVRHHINQNSPMDVEPRGAPGLQFAAGILWRLAPDRLVAVAEQVGGSWITGWLAAEVSDLNTSQRDAILRSANARVVAVGVSLLWDRTHRDLALPTARTAALEADMAAANISPFDRYLAEILLTTRAARSEVGLNQAFLACASQAPVQLDATAQDRLVGTLVADGPLHGIVRVAALARVIPTPVVANQLHQWCVDGVVKNLHLKGSPAPSRDTRSPRWDDASVHLSFAQSFWHLHDAQAPSRYVKDILGKMNFRAVDAPLFPTRDYGAWSEQVTALLWGMTLGVALVDAAPAGSHADALRCLRPQMIKVLAEFRPGLWHRYSDLSGLLAGLVKGLSAWVDDSATPPADSTAWGEALSRPSVPELWRVYGVMGSQQLTQAHIADLNAWVQNPASSPSLCERPRRVPIRGELAALFDARKASIPQFAAQLDNTRDTLLAWWDARYPAV